MSEAGEIVGMVDVLKLTYATLDQINSMSTGEGEGPAWQKFWLSLDHETESAVSGEGGGGGSSRMPRTPITSRSAISPDMREHQRPELERGDSVMPHESASHHDDDSPTEDRSAVAGMPPPEDMPFAFKFKAPSGRVHRLQVTASAGVQALVASVSAKLGGELDAVGGEASVDDAGKLGKEGFALSYLDSEGDTVSITTEQDITEAITMARKSRRDKVDLFVHDPSKPPLSATLAPHPGLVGPPTPADSGVQRGIRKGKNVGDSEEEEEGVTTRKREAKERSTQQGQGQQEQVIAGVPNELLLPGAVAVLAVVIVSVFAFGRGSGNR